MEANLAELEGDKNLGLVKKLLKQYPRVRVQELSDTYLTLKHR